MLRRNLRDSYQTFAMTDEQKNTMLTEILEARPRDTDIKGKTWKPRGQAGSWTLIVLLIAALIGAGLYAAYSYGVIDYISDRFYELKLQWEETVPGEDTTEPSEIVTEATTDPEPVPEPYEAMVSKYVQAIEEHWDLDRCEAENVSGLLMFLEAPSQLGYTHIDLDGNGLRELILTDGNVIYDLYTYNEEGAVRILSGAERNSYSLTDQNMIVNVGSNGAANTIYTFYRYSAGNLIVDQQVIFDASADEENPWFRGFGDLTTAQPIAEDEANSIIDSFVKIPIPYKAITEYSE